MKPTRSRKTRLGLDRGQRRDVQRRLTGLGFDTKVNGKFDEETRAVITRWQAARGYPKTGFLNKLQHQGAAIGDRIDPRGLRSIRTTSRRAVPVIPAAEAAVTIRGGGGGPGALFGGMMGGLFRR